MIWCDWREAWLIRLDKFRGPEPVEGDEVVHNSIISSRDRALPNTFFSVTFLKGSSLFQIGDGPDEGGEVGIAQELGTGEFEF